MMTGIDIFTYGAVFLISFLGMIAAMFIYDIIMRHKSVGTLRIDDRDPDKTSYTMEFREIALNDLSDKKWVVLQVSETSQN